MKKINMMTTALIPLLFAGAVSANTTLPTEVSNEALLKSCVTQNGNTCQLTSDITLSDTISINNDVTIDLNNHNITTSTATKMFIVNKGDFELTNKGSLITTKEDGILIYGSTEQDDANYTVVTIGKDVTIQAHDYAMYVGQNKGYGYGVVVNIDGTLSGDTYGGFYINGTLQDNTKNYPLVNINDGATIKSSEEIGIYAAGYAHWNIGDASINGHTSGIGIKAGKFTINGATITATGEDLSSTVVGDGNSITGAGAAIQFETNASYADHIEMNIQSATVTSEKGYAFLEYVGQTDILSLLIKDGTYTSATNLDVFKVTNNFTLTKFISGGNFSSDVTKYVADNLVSKKMGNTYTVATENKVNVTEVTNGTVTVDKTKAIVGETVTITATPNEGYELTTLEVVDEEGNSVEVVDNAFTMPNSEVTVTVTMTKVETTVELPVIDTEEEVEEVVVGVKESEELEDVLLDSLTEALKAEENKELAETLTNTSSIVEVEIDTVEVDTIEEVVVEKIQEAAGEATIATYFDITVAVKNASNGEVLGNVTTLTKEIELMILLPEELKNTDKNVNRTYYVIREHNGQVTKLPATLSEDGKYLVFKSNEFSTYALAYNDAKTTNVSNPQTYDGISSYIVIGSIALLAVLGLAINKKRLFN